jgi:hypothetical protein
MGLLYKVLNLATGKWEGRSSPSIPITRDFVSTGQTVFALADDITDNDYIEFLVDGRENQEGIAWTRNSATNQLTASELVPAGKWVRVKIIKG